MPPNPVTTFDEIAAGLTAQNAARRRYGVGEGDLLGVGGTASMQGLGVESALFGG
jgi:hypothetical protein